MGVSKSSPEFKRSTVGYHVLQRGINGNSILIKDAKVIRPKFRRYYKP